ncbi:beta-1,4-galactosyltransferase 7 [Leptinotarsa decemlineata]|uniref:beta-1,4-galactosyltransferase 7 n=1 Tax=Leptinotarsa decemlineata TaxID=7539 RepID=UPI003D306309
MTMRVKTAPLTYTILLTVIVSVIFLISVVVSIISLSNDQCNCSTAKVKYELVPQNRKKLISNKHKLAVLVPYRERFEELLEFAPYMNRFLDSQNVDHDIFILNQVDQFRFNRASLINAGFLQVKNDYDYVAMHDVDLLPLNPNLRYTYPEQPLHLAAPNLHPKYHYEKFIGGILLINSKQLELVNGLSNRYWGWGLEDDEFYVRLKDARLNVTRPENITSGVNDTFRHIHGKERKRDSTKCFNQREVTRRRDRHTGLHDVKFDVVSRKNMEIDGAPLLIINIRLHCNRTATPWCDCSTKKGDQKG